MSSGARSTATARCPRAFNSSTTEAQHHAPNPPPCTRPNVFMQNPDPSIAQFRSTTSMIRQPDLNPVLRSDLQQFLDFFLRRRRGCCSTLGHRHAELEEHLFETGWGDRDEHLGRAIRLVLERVRRADWHVGEHASRGDQRLAVNREGDLAIEDIEAFLFSAVDVWGWSAARRDDGLEQGVLAIRVFAGRQKAVHVADDSNCAAFAWFLQRRNSSRHELLPELLSFLPRTIMPIFDDHEGGIVGGVNLLHFRPDDPVIGVLVDDPVSDRHDQINHFVTTLAPSVFNSLLKLSAVDGAMNEGPSAVGRHPDPL